LATRIGDSSKSLYSLDLTRKVALVFGNEHRGVSDECAKAADGHFAIPMFGMIQSLNVSVACAVALYEAVRQRIGRGHYETPKLGANSLVRLLQEWERKQR
ncbi:MAG: RNA methyltransferase, partial [Ignavibacteriales bacterium]|nr:RNA methyltransferase [Ignavibacteriales bacterium]